jgi:hypothetical protein
VGEEEQLYKIWYLDEHNKLTFSIGRNVRAGQLELSWFDIKSASLIIINKARYLCRYEYLEELKENGDT